MSYCCTSVVGGDPNSPIARLMLIFDDWVWHKVNRESLPPKPRAFSSPASH